MTQTATSARVLVVDDNAQVLNLLSRFLRLVGVEHISARSPTEALEKSKRESFRLLISDIDMPGMNGVELARRLRRIDPSLTTIGFSGREKSERPPDASQCFERIYEKPGQLYLMVRDVVRRLKEVRRR